jgi:hypothetical protein
MQEGTTEWSRILAVLSPRFFESKFTSAEWSAAFTKDPTGELGLLIPIRIAECEPPGLLRARTYVDLVGLAEDAARKELLDGVKQGRAKPEEAIVSWIGQTETGVSSSDARSPKTAEGANFATNADSSSDAAHNS